MKRWLSILLLSLSLLFLAVVLLTRYALLPLVPEYRGQLESLLSEQLGRPVSIGQLNARWNGIEPGVALTDLTVLDAKGAPALVLPAVSASLSWSSIPAFQPRLSHLTIEGADLDIRRTADGRLWVAGLDIPMEGEGDSPALAWLLKQGDVQITGSALTWTDLKRSPAPLRLTDVQFRLSNVVNLHRAAGRARLLTSPADDDVAGSDAAERSTAGSEIELQLRFFTSLLGQRPADMTQWNGELYVQADRLNARKLRPWLDVPVWLTDLEGGGRVWVEFDKARLRHITIDPRLALLGIYNPESQHGMQMRQIVGRLEWNADHANNQQFSIRDLVLVSGEGVNVGPMSAELRLDDHVDPANRSGRLKADRLNLDVITAVLRDAPLPASVRQKLDTARPGGVVKELDARWQGDLQQAASVKVKAAFENLSLQSFSLREGAQLPGFSGLSGEVSASPEGGRWSLKGQAGHLEIHDVFQVSSLPFSRLSTEGTWKAGGGPDRWLVLDFDSAEWDHNGMRLTGAGDLVFGRGEMPIVNLSGSMARVPLADIPAWMPLALGPDTLRWLNASLIAGTAQDGRWKLKGDVWHFPFGKQKLGDFSLSARIQQGEVRFSPDWPSIRQIEGDIRFANDVLTVTGKTAKTREAPLTDVRVRIPSLEADTTVVQIDGTSKAPVDELIRYVNNSPVSDMLSGFLQTARGTGTGSLGISVNLPLDNPEKTTLRGTLALTESDLFLMRGIPQLSKIRGTLDFTHAGLGMKAVSAQALGGALKVDAATGSDGIIKIKVDGTASAPALKRYLGLPPTLQASGQTRYLANVVVRPGAGEPDITVESNLQGLAINLPEPLVKTAGDAWPLEFRMLPTVMKNGELQRDELRISLASPKGQVLAGRIERDRSNGRTDPLRGALAVGEPMIMPDQGIRLNVSLPRLDLDQWQRTQFSDSGPLSDDSIGVGPETPDPGVSLAPDRITLKTDQLILGNKLFHRLTLVTNRQKSRWSFDVTADEAKGTGVWTPGTASDKAGTVQLNFARLTIPDSQAVEVTVLPPDPTDLFEVPALDITVDEMALGKTRLGRLRLLAANEGEGSVKQWILREFQISNPDVVMKGKGDWRRELAGQPRRTRIEFTMDVANSGRLLDRVGIEKVLRGGAGVVSGNLQWRGPPQSLDYASMSGRLKLDIKDGQFLRAEPGVARLLGVLSLQSLPRRLTLDFSDIFAAGFSFDQIFANASISDGILVTRDFKMRGTGASVLMDGRVDLVKETQDLRAVVLPEVNAAGGTLVYSALMANPAVGLATFLAQLVLKDPLSKVFSYDMKVTGTWDDPVVEKVDSNAVPAAPPAGKGPNN